MTKTTTLPELTKENLLKCKGYNAKFIDGKTTINYLPLLTKKHRTMLPAVEGAKNGVLHYSNLSICYNKERMAALFSVYNIDGDKNKLGTRPSFRKDPRIDEKIQLNDTFYKLGKNRDFEIGHLCSNNEMSWGPNARMQTLQTFFFTNSVPQTERLNVGLWRSLETYLINQTKSTSNNNRICVFTGPIFRDTDPVLKSYNNFQLPLLFFKVIVFEYKTKLYSTAFIISHQKRVIDLNLQKMQRTAEKSNEEKPFENFQYKKVFQVSMDLLNKETGINFKWKNVTPVAVSNDTNQIKKIRNIDSADDAQNAMKGSSIGKMSEEFAARKAITANEMKTKTFSLNMILP